MIVRDIETMFTVPVFESYDHGTKGHSVMSVLHKDAVLNNGQKFHLMIFLNSSHTQPLYPSILENLAFYPVTQMGSNLGQEN